MSEFLVRARELFGRRTKRSDHGLEQIATINETDARILKWVQHVQSNSEKAVQTLNLGPTTDVKTNVNRLPLWWGSMVPRALKILKVRSTPSFQVTTTHLKDDSENQIRVFIFETMYPDIFFEFQAYKYATGEVGHETYGLVRLSESELIRWRSFDTADLSEFQEYKFLLPQRRHPVFQKLATLFNK